MIAVGYLEEVLSENDPLIPANLGERQHVAAAAAFLQIDPKNLRN